MSLELNMTSLRLLLPLMNSKPQFNLGIISSYKLLFIKQQKNKNAHYIKCLVSSG